MSTFFNIDVDNLIADYELSFINANNNFINEYKQIHNNILKAYTHKVEEHSKVLKQISDINNKISTSSKTLQDLTDKIECEQQILITENDRLESFSNECKLLSAEENNLKCMINETKIKKSQVCQEKKENIKKFKKKIEAFKTGVKMYEQFLQMSMKIENKEINSVINITMKNLSNNMNYHVIFEEHDNYFKLLDITPHSQPVIKAAKMYNQNKDVPGLLAFLCETK